MTSRQAWAIVRSRLEAEGLKEQTIASKTRLWRVIERWLAAEKGPSFDLRRITRRDASMFLLFLDHGRLRPPGAAYSQHVKAACLDLVRRAFDILVDVGRLLTNPWARVSIERAPSKPRRIPTATDVAHLLDAINPRVRVKGLTKTRIHRDRALFELLYATGMRPKEAGALRWEDIDLEARMVHIRSTKIKRDRVVPLTKAAASHLATWKRVSETSIRGGYAFGSGRALATSTINNRLKDWCIRLGLSAPWTAYSLRHACASQLLDAGADLRYVQALLGHGSLQTTILYTLQAEEQVKRYYKSFHPRENLLWAEVDAEYRRHWEELIRDLGIAAKQREKRRWRLAASEKGSYTKGQ